MSGKTYVGNTSGKSAKPKKIYVGNSSNKATLVKKIYVGNSSNKAVKVWPNSILPDAYQRVEFIRNTNQESYISTDLTSINNYTTLYFDFAITTFRDSSYGSMEPESNSFGLQAGYKSSNNYYLFGLITPSSGVIEMVVPYDTVSPRSSWNYYKKVATVNYTVGSRHKILFNQTGGKFYYDNNNVGSTDATYNLLSNINFPLFGFRTYTNYFYGGPAVNLYQFSAWQNGTLVRDMYPCYRISDNVTGMYDIVNDVFYTNSGSGTFYKGPNVEG